MRTTVTVLRCIVWMLCMLGAHSACAQALPTRPVIFIPGILGSKLCDSTGKVIWGSVSSLSNITQLSLIPGVEKPVLNSCGLIEEVQVFGPLWSIKQYSSLLENLEEAGYSRQKSLFVFHYDWRQSTVQSAEAFAKFVATHVPNGDFDIVAHSMGGLVAKVYFQNIDQKPRVNKIIYLGTPFLGSANTFGLISDGWGILENLLAGGKDAIRETVLSLPGFIELLPRYQECCYIRRKLGDQRWLDAYDPGVWRELGWLPPHMANGENFQRFKHQLSEARKLTDTFRQRAPSGVSEISFAGDAHSTRRLLGMRESNTTPSGWLFSSDAGDGTVPVWSAANDPGFSNVAGTLQSFAQHATIFDDKWVMSQLKRSLVDVLPSRNVPISTHARPTLRARINGTETDLQISTAELIVANSIAVIGEPISIELVLTVRDWVAEQPPAVNLAAKADEQGSSTSLVVTQAQRPSDWPAQRLRFAITGPAWKTTGVKEITAFVGSEFSVAAHIAVLNDERGVSK